MSARQGVRKPPRSRAFFFEMLLNMLIFALCATVVFQVFVEAKINIQRSTALTQLTLQAESLAESFKASDGDITDLETTLGISPVDGKPVTEYYDSDLKPCSSLMAKYSLVCTIKEQGTVNEATITASDGEDQLFVLDVKNYQPRKAGNN